MISITRRPDAIRYAVLFPQLRRRGERFAASARPLATQFASYPIEPTGREGEALATDVALIGDADASRLLRLAAAASENHALIQKIRDSSDATLAGMAADEGLSKDK